MRAYFFLQCKFSTKKHYGKNFLIFFEFFFQSKIKNDNVSFYRCGFH